MPSAYHFELGEIATLILGIGSLFLGKALRRSIPKAFLSLPMFAITKAIT